MKSSLSRNDTAVLGALGRADKPLSAYDILAQTRSEALKAPMQVYRALEKLAGRGLVHRIEALNAFVACSAHSQSCGADDHRHQRHRPAFVICRACGSVREFEDSRLSEFAAEAAGSSFAVDTVSLEVYGRCSACAAD
jgi:Fur family zinc uptake transcriptional regulator